MISNEIVQIDFDKKTIFRKKIDSLEIDLEKIYFKEFLKCIYCIRM